MEHSTEATAPSAPAPKQEKKTANTHTLGHFATHEFSYELWLVGC